MNGVTENVYDYYFALGYETREQIDHYLKNNKPATQALAAADKVASGGYRQDSNMSTMTEKLAGHKVLTANLHSQTDAIATGTSMPTAATSHAAELPAYSLAIINMVDTTPATFLNKYQVDFDITGLPTWLNYYNPDDIDICVAFEHIASGNVWYVNVYFGIAYNRNLCNNTSDFPDPTIHDDPDPYKIKHGVSHMVPCTSNLFYSNQVFTDITDGDPAYLTETGEHYWHIKFAPPKLGDWSFTIAISIYGGLNNIIPVI